MIKSYTNLPSLGELDILKHICYQIEEELKEISPDYTPEGGKSAEGPEDVRGMRKFLLQLMNEASRLDIRVVIVIDALNKVDSGGRAMKVRDVILYSSNCSQKFPFLIANHRKASILQKIELKGNSRQFL